MTTNNMMSPLHFCWRQIKSLDCCTFCLLIALIFYGNDAMFSSRTHTMILIGTTLLWKKTTTTATETRTSKKKDGFDKQNKNFACAFFTDFCTFWYIFFYFLVISSRWRVAMWKPCYQPDYLLTYISLLLLYDCHVKMPNFTFYGGRKQATMNFSFSF